MKCPKTNILNLLYYYQRFHGKNVATGYTHSIKDSPDATIGGVLGDMIMDNIWANPLK